MFLAVAVKIQDQDAINKALSTFSFYPLLIYLGILMALYLVYHEYIRKQLNIAMYPLAHHERIIQLRGREDV